MAYIGIGHSGSHTSFLREFAEQHTRWLSGDRNPRFFGDSFIVLYDSNTSREFVNKCIEAAEENSITVYPMSQPLTEPSHKNSTSNKSFHHA